MKRAICIVVVALLTVGALTVSAAFDQADASSPLGCPSICLTGGLVGLGGRTVSVSGIDGASASAIETRDYDYSWIALDLTEFPPVSEDLHIHIHATGNNANGVFQGDGDVDLSAPSCYYCMEMEDVHVTATALTVTATGNNGSQQFDFAGTTVGGGIATYKANYDYTWEYCDC